MSFDKTILCVDDNSDHNELLQFFFEQAGYKVISCSSSDDCLDCLKTVKLSAVIFGNWLEDVHFNSILNEMKILQPELPFVFFTADAREASRQKALRMGAHSYLVKPNDLENLVPVIGKIISKEYT